MYLTTSVFPVFGSISKSQIPTPKPLPAADKFTEAVEVTGPPVGFIFVASSSMLISSSDTFELNLPSSKFI